MKLYGIPASRAFRSIWAVEEVGAEYERVPTTFGPDSKAPEFLAINPNGRIPALVDGDLKLFESMAINLYLARKYGKDLWPESLEDQALAVQWSFWGMSEIEPSLLEVLMNRVFLPEGQRDSAKAEVAAEALQKPLAVLDGALAGRDHLLGGGFTIADLNVASVLSMANFCGFDVSNHPNVKRWFDACLSRPAAQRAQKG
jgi:glutathione S-transferase